MTARYTPALTIRGEDLFADASGMTQGDNPDSDREWFALRKYVAALETENAALRADTARLDWLVEKRALAIHSPGKGARLEGWHVCGPMASYINAEAPWAWVAGNLEIREAIDAGMKGAP